MRVCDCCGARNLVFVVAMPAEAALPVTIIWSVLILVFAATFASDFSNGIINGFFVLYAIEQHVLPSGIGLISSIINLSYVVTQVVTPFMFVCMPVKRLKQGL